MIPEIARKLLSLVNVKKNMDCLEVYAEHRIALMHIVLEQSEDIKDIYMAQGAIRELKRIKTLRDEVIANGKK